MRAQAYLTGRDALVLTGQNQSHQRVNQLMYKATP
jgi:hypothetical protein